MQSTRTLALERGKLGKNARARKAPEQTLPTSKVTFGLPASHAPSCDESCTKWMLADALQSAAAEPIAPTTALYSSGEKAWPPDAATQ